MDRTEMCASGGKCEGSCRKMNLNRDRKNKQQCPAFYIRRIEIQVLKPDDR